MRRAIYKYVFLVCVLVALVRGGKAESYIAEKVTDAYGLSEAPHWDQSTKKLYFVDIYNQYIRKLDPATGAVNSVHIDHGTVGVVVPVNDEPNQFVIGARKDVLLVTWDGVSDKLEDATVLCSLDSPQSDTMINDGKVDSIGNLWIGTKGKDNGARNLGTLYYIDEKLVPVKKISPVSMSNGLTWNIEDNTFYYIDSPTRQVAAYDYYPSSGTISNKRIVFDLNNTDLKGIPDGMTIDIEGNLLIALFSGHHVIHVNPRTGKLLRKIKIPAKDVTSVAFGGPLQSTLYVTTSGHNLTAEQRKATPDAGSVFAVKIPGVRGSVSNSFVKWY